MAPNLKVVNAFRAMKDLGISEDKVKPILKNLLKLYDKNWELIEAENYRLLVDTIFENEEAEEEAKKKAASTELVIGQREQEEEETQEQDDLERPLKRLRLRHQHGQSSQSHNNSSCQAAESLIVPKDEPLELPEVPPQKLLQSTEDTNELRNGAMMSGTQHFNSQLHDKNKMKQPLSPKNLMIKGRSDSSDHASVDKSPSVSQRAEDDGLPSSGHIRSRRKETFSPQNSSDKFLDSERSSWEACIEVPPTGQGLTSPIRNITVSQALIIPKEEPLTDDSLQFDVPIAVVHPETRNGDSSQNNCLTREQDSLALVVSEPVDGSTSDTGTGSELANVLSESSSQLQIASLPLGEVKLSLSCAFSGRSDFHIPDIDTVVKLVQDKCLRSYKILDPNFSVMNLMKDMCECFLQLGSEKSEEQTHASPKTDPSETIPSVVSNPPHDTMNDLSSEREAVELTLPVTGIDGTSLLQNGTDSNGGHLEIEQNGVEDANCKSLVVVQQHELTSDRIYSLHDVIDICKGHERVVISLVNDVNDESPPSFRYIPKNVVFQNAFVNFSLARIGDDNCCSHCLADCLSLSTPCACAHETGGEFAYTADGLVKEEFLEECLSMNHDPEKHCQFFCKECPLERSKNEDITEPCKGHLVRKFIKECWWKCGCNKQCGNRVVQRGVTRNLQVFMTKGKGWGLRTLEDLPKGAFVCEYVGEVLTNTEVLDRVSKCLKGEEHSYPVLLDADWRSEGVLKDEEALCLDATYYGNVARFINHRCFDSTMVEIPVEIETPDHHYYHLAFFTSRKVKAMEELTWDYGIDDIDHPVKAFHCQCGSQFCRNMRRPSRSRFSRR